MNNETAENINLMAHAMGRLRYFLKTLWQGQGLVWKEEHDEYIEEIVRLTVLEAKEQIANELLKVLHKQ